MPNQNSINTDVTLNSDGMQIAGGTTKRILKWAGSDITLSGLSSSAIMTLPSSSDTLVGRNTTDTLRNKTLDTPTITGGTMTSTSISSGTMAGTTITGGTMNGTAISGATIYQPIISESTTELSTPSFGVKVYSKLRAGRNMLSQVSPNGVDFAFQPGLFANPVMLYQAQGGNTTNIFLLNYVNSIYSTATALTQTSGAGLLASVRRIRYPMSATTTAGVAGTRHAVAQWWRGDAAGRGGFFAVWRFGIPTIATNQRFFCGMSATTAAFSNADPSSFVNFAGVIKDAGDTANFQFAFNDASGTATKTSTGIATTGSTTKLYEVRVYCAPNNSTMYVSMFDIEANVLAEANNSSDIPATTTFLCPHIWSNNSANSPSPAFTMDVQSIYLESDN